MAEKKQSAADKKAAGDKKSALETALAQIEKQFGKGAVMKLGQNVTMQVDAISTGSISLDMALGIGGLPRGRIVEIYGPEASGKTTLALHCIAEGQKGGGEVAFIDVEHALDPVYAKALGVDIDSSSRQPAGHGRAGAGDLRGAGALGRHRLCGRGLRGGHGAPCRDRGRNGRRPCGPAGPPDEPGHAQADGHHRQDGHRRHLHQPAAFEGGHRVRQSRGDCRRQRAEILFLCAYRRAPYRAA